ncbi:MAG: sigma-70 family RNA polymerase sigma factor [Planctomycetes bacterium]|nr:sigma-70 family RNA polymerase sigma factor [Planctomycetota bacterium]
MSETISHQLVLVHRGDRAALQRLLADHLPWIEERVRRRLSNLLRRDGETQDFVQEAMLEALRDGPRFAVEDVDAFRALLARIVENNLRDRCRHLQRERRDIRKQRALPNDSVLKLGAAARPITEPPTQAERNECAAWMRLALELLGPVDREVIRLRIWDGVTFGAIGSILSLSEDAVRKRYRRALPRLAEKLELLQSGDWRKSLGEPEE